jgi:hypothetical protein
MLVKNIEINMCRHAAFSRRLRSLANFVPAVVASRVQGLTSRAIFGVAKKKGFEPHVNSNFIAFTLILNTLRIFSFLFRTIGAIHVYYQLYSAMVNRP